jgi:hypothetical protein
MSAISPALRFTAEQQTAMNHFFNKSIKNWNRIAPCDKIWSECFSSLLEDYRVQAPFANGKAARVGHAALKLKKKQMDLKEFFRRHVLVDPSQIQKKMGDFIQKVSVNQKAHYICLIPSHLECIVDCKFSIKNRWMMSRDDWLELDLLLHPAFNDEDVHEMHVNSKFFIALPSNQKAYALRLKESIDGAFAKKIQEEERAEFWVSVSMIAACALGVLFWIRSRSS